MCWKTAGQQFPLVVTDGRADFAATRWLVWLPACVFLGAAVAWAAVVAQGYFAPLVLYPLLVGIGLGGLFVGMIRVGQVGNRLAIVTGLVLAIAVAAAGQHYIGYRIEVARAGDHDSMFRRAQTLFSGLMEGKRLEPPSDFAQYLRRQAAQGRPLDIAGYVARGPVAWLTWILDAALTAAAAVAMVLPASRQPYCNACRSWYRTTRGGRLSSGDGARLASLVGVELSQPPAWVRYRLINCTGGCGPTGLMLFWETLDEEPAAVRNWMTPDLRDRVTRVLDEILHEKSSEPERGNGVKDE